MNDADSGSKKQTIYSAVEGVQTITELNAHDSLYATFHETVRDKTWDTVTNGGEEGDPATVTSANAAESLNDNRLNQRKGWTFVVPTGIKDGVWVMMVCDNEEPAIGDTVLFAKICNIKGGKIYTMDNR